MKNLDNVDFYWIVRLLIFGIGFGMLGGQLISIELGLGWTYGYLLCWIFSYYNYNKLRYAKRGKDDE